MHLSNMHFFYDAQGKPCQVNRGGTIYNYVLNVQGDVVGLTDASGNLVVEYKYDAWGKLLGISGSLATSLGTANPLRYRGYVYDNETGLYYLHSRYYDPEIRRFISMDNITGCIGEILSHNTFVYCIDNPIMYIDDNGKSPVHVNLMAADSGYSFYGRNKSKEYVRNTDYVYNCFDYFCELDHIVGYCLHGMREYMSTTAKMTYNASGIIAPKIEKSLDVLDVFLKQDQTIENFCDFASGIAEIVWNVLELKKVLLNPLLPMNLDTINDASNDIISSYIDAQIALTKLIDGLIFAKRTVYEN